MGNRLTLILGGARSGKSDFAEALARKRGGDSVLFVATAEARDDEMRARIQHHRAHRSLAWATLEAPRDLARALRNTKSAHVTLIDCATLWASNVLLAEETNAEQTMRRELDDVLAWYHDVDTELIIVSNEVGQGIVPAYELGRTYRDLLGRVNRQIANRADEVFVLFAGLPVNVKALAVRWEDG